MKHNATNVHSTNYSFGDLVLIKSNTGNKLSIVFNGRYEVTKDYSPNVLVLETIKKYLFTKIEPNYISTSNKKKQNSITINVTKLFFSFKRGVVEEYNDAE